MSVSFLRFNGGFISQSFQFRVLDDPVCTAKCDSECVIDCECRPSTDCVKYSPYVYIALILAAVIFLISLGICYVVSKRRRAQRALQFSRANLARRTNTSDLVTSSQPQAILDPNITQSQFSYNRSDYS